MHFLSDNSFMNLLFYVDGMSIDMLKAQLGTKFDIIDLGAFKKILDRNCEKSCP